MEKEKSEIEKIVEEKLQEQMEEEKEKIREEIKQEFKKEKNKEIDETEEKVSRRKFLKMAGLGAGGLALSSSVSAIEWRPLGSGGGGSQTLSEVLSEGNDISGNDIVDSGITVWDGTNSVLPINVIDGSGGTSGQFLQTDGTNTSWSNVNINPGGSDTEVQYNNSGSFEGTSALTYNDSTNEVTASNPINADGGIKYPDNNAGTDSVIPSSYTSSNYVIQNSIKFGTSGSTNSSSYTTIANSDIALNFDRFKDKDGKVYINVIYHVWAEEYLGDAAPSSARLYRQNSGTAVSGTEVNWTSSNFEIVESGWVDMSSESGVESYQIQLKNDDGTESKYNGTTLLIATPQA